MCKRRDWRSGNTLGTVKHEAESGIGCQDHCTQTKEVGEANGGWENEGPVRFGDEKSVKRLKNKSNFRDSLWLQPREIEKWSTKPF